MEPIIQVPRTFAEDDPDEVQSISHETNFSKCIICQESKTPKKKFPLSKATKDGLERVICCAKIRESYENQQQGVISRIKCLTPNLLEREDILWHRYCYSSFTNESHLVRLGKRKQEAREETDGCDAPVSKNRRSSVNAIEWSKCIFCQDDSENLINIQTKETSQLVIDRAKCHPVMSVRMAGVIDLIASEAKYHLKCYSKFKRDTLKILSSENMPDIDQEKVCFEEVMSMLENGITQGNIYSVKSVWLSYSSKLKSSFNIEPGSYKCARFKERMHAFLGDKVSFIQPMKSSQSPLIIPSNLGETVAHSLIRHPSLQVEDEKLETTDGIDMETEVLSWLFRVSLKVHNDIKTTEGHAAIGDIDIEHAEKVVPQSLYMLVHLLSTGDIKDETNEDSEIKAKVLSICQDLVFLASKGRKLTPKHIGLGLTVHQATRSKELVDLLYSAGHSVSYDAVLRMDTSIANNVLQRYRDNNKVFVPCNFPGASSTDCNHYAIDNIDMNEETLSGKGTFHATQCTALRRSSANEQQSNLQIPITSTRKLALEIPSELHELQQATMVQDKPEPVEKGSISQDWYSPDNNVVDSALKKDLIWLLCRLKEQIPEIQNIPGWSGFNQLLESQKRELTVVGPLPIINAPAHDYDTLWTMIVRCLAMSKLLQGKFTVITMDEALYCKAKMLQWSNVPACRNLVLMLGGFHTQMSFTKAIGKFVESSGLKEIWIESEVYGENTATNIIQGKVWNRVIRAHKLTCEALWRIFWPMFVNWCKDEGKELKQLEEESITKLAEKISESSSDESQDMFKHLLDKITPLTKLIHEFDEKHKDYATIQYWRIYMNLVLILLRFTRSLREGNWKLFLASFAEMLPWFAVFDHINYTRWGIIFLADMQLLPLKAPAVYEAFLKGDFVTKESRNKFNQIPNDQALEHVNRSGKVAGGLIGITRTDTARDRWCLTYNERATISEDTKAMFGLKKEEENDHKDSSSSRVKRDEDDISKLKSTFMKYDVFRSTKDLVAITTGDIATDEVKEDLLHAKDKGSRLVSTFIQERLGENADKNFHDTIKLQKLKTFESLYAVPVQVEKSKILSLKADRDFFRRVIVALESGRSVDVDHLLQQELSPVPLSLATINGKLRPTNKADLASILTKGSSYNQLPVSSTETCTIIDGMAAVQAMGNRIGAKTFGEWSDSFQRFAVSHYSERCTRVDIVFDRYPEHSIKQTTRDKRKDSKARGVRRNVESRDQKIGSWEKFIVLEENKASLVNFLSEDISKRYQSHDSNRELILSGGFHNPLQVWSSLTRDTISLSSSHEEADTRMILHGKDAKLRGYQEIHVCSRDTDVLVLLLAHLPSLCPRVFMVTGTSKKKIYVAVHQILITKECQRSLLAFHAITGCDTTSQFAGIGKLSAWNVFQTCTNLLGWIGEQLVPNERAISDAEAFVCQLYDKGIYRTMYAFYQTVISNNIPTLFSKELLLPQLTRCVLIFSDVERGI